jgi:hypothetical protein
MKKTLIASSLFAALSLSSNAADLPKLLNSVLNFQNSSYTSKEEMANILAVAKSEDYEPLVVQCMVVYTLYAGSIGDAGTCQAGFQSVCKRYPASDAVYYLRQTDLFAEPCRACFGFGIVQQKSTQGCLTCNKTGVCTECAGKGKVKSKAGLRGPVRIGTWYTKTRVYRSDGTYTDDRTPIANFGTGQSTEPAQRDARCPVCSGTGKCRSCKGSPLEGILLNIPCTACNGKAKELNVPIARAGLVRATMGLLESLKLAVACESCYEKALLDRDPYQQLDALNVCLTTYEKAFNIDVVRDAKNELEKDVIAFKKLHETEESARKIKKAQQENQKQQHEDILLAIQAAKVPRVALEQIQTFITDNPDSPVMVKAKLLLAEIGQRVAEEQKIVQRNRYIFFGVATLIGLAGAGWLLSCIRFTKKVEITKIELTPPTRYRPPLEEKKIPFRPRSGASGTTPVILQRATTATANENYVECPECGGLLECSPSIQNTVVICASCQKAFNLL